MELDALERQPEAQGLSSGGGGGGERHVKTRFFCVTEDSWRLHLIRTVQPGKLGTRTHPVILCPGLGSSGAYSFDLSPAVSLADFLASRGWDVWTVELRGARAQGGSGGRAASRARPLPLATAHLAGARRPTPARPRPAPAPAPAAPQATGAARSRG
jgi:hypothetical protein